MSVATLYQTTIWIFFTIETDGTERSLSETRETVHAYRKDNSFRCFHIDLDQLELKPLANLWLRVTAMTGTRLVQYAGHDDSATPTDSSSC